MRIVHAVRSDGFAGVERHVATLARAQAGQGDEVVVVGGDTSRMRAATGTAHPVRILPGATTAHVVRALLAVAPGADVVHVHMTAAETAASLATLVRRRVGPVVSTRHFACPRGTGRLGPVVAAVARRPVVAQLAISRSVAEAVDGPCTVVHPGVEDRGPSPAAAEREPVVLVAQRLEEEKRTDLALRAFAAARLGDAGWRLDLAGDGAQRARLESLAATLGIGAHVRFLGRRDDVDALMRRASLLLAPCPVEGLGLSVLEAMASGLPVVAASAGGHVELLDGLDPAALYDPLDPGAAGAALAALAAASARRDALARAARERQTGEFSTAAWLAGTTAAYRRVLDA